MTITIKTGLQFLFPIYLCLLVLVIILISKFSGKFSNLTMHCSVQVLATLMYLSFSKLMLTVITIFVPATIHTENGTVTVWYADGNVSYWNDVGHIVLLLVAVATAVIYLIPFLLWSTFASLLSRRWKWIRKNRNLVDVFHGPYREGWGWWFGARLWAFVMCSLSYTIFRGCDPSLLLVLNFSTIAILLTIQVYFKPYRSGCVNIIDSVLIADLLMLELVSLHSFDNGVSNTHSLVVFLLELFVALVLVLLVTVKAVCKFKTGRVFLNKIMGFLFKPKQQTNKGRIGEEIDFREPLLEVDR